MTTPGPTLAARIVADVRDSVRTGELRPGDRLPTYAELRKRYGCSITVVREALNTLKQAGDIYTHQGRGVYVAEPAEGAPAAGSDVARVHELGWQRLVAAVERGLRDIADALRHRS